jgi:DNA-binding MarR family transcriptional regulator
MAAGEPDYWELGLEDRHRLVFQFFNEVGIIHQLSAAMLNNRLPEGLHVSHFSVLNHCVRLGDGKTPLALAKAFQVSKGTMTHTLRELSRRGFVTLAPNAEDGRSKLVFLTPEGRAFQKRAVEGLFPAMDRLGDKIDIEAMARMLPDLVALRSVLDDNRDI